MHARQARHEPCVAPGAMEGRFHDARHGATLTLKFNEDIDMTRTLALAAALSAATGAAAAQDLTEVSFGTNWLPQAEHGGYYQAMMDGTYEECGLDVTILPGGPQVNNRALLLAGRIDFNMGGNLLQAFTAIEQDIPLKLVAAHFQKEPQVIMTHPGEGLDTWESLQDPDVTLFIGENGFQSYYQWMIDTFDFTEEQREPYTFNPAPFLANPKSGQQGYVTSEPFAIEREGGFEPNIFLIADYGFNSYATTVEAMQQTIDERPEVVECFVDGSALGWYTYLYGDRSAGDAAILDANPEMTREQLDFSVTQMIEYGIADSGAALDAGIGAMSPERIADFYNTMVDAGVAPEGIDPDADLHDGFREQGCRPDAESRAYGELILAHDDTVLSPDFEERPASRGATDASAVVTLSGVGKTFENGTQALARTDLRVGEGEFLSLLGPSGCGKSTILRLVSGLDTPSEGSLVWRENRAGFDDNRVGFVFQEPTLMPWAKVFDNVWLPLRLKGTSRRAASERIMDALTSVGLADSAQSYPRELSGGMKMRVSIARALATDPRVLLMDEPFAALDEITRFRLNDDLLRLWADKNWTVVFVTHSVFESVYLSTRIAVMKGRPGRVVDEIPVDEPSPREPSFRTSTKYADLARRTSTALHEAMGLFE